MGLQDSVVAPDECGQRHRLKRGEGDDRGPGRCSNFAAPCRCARAVFPYRPAPCPSSTALNVSGSTGTFKPERFGHALPRPGAGFPVHRIVLRIIPVALVVTSALARGSPPRRWRRPSDPVQVVAVFRIRLSGLRLQSPPLRSLLAASCRFPHPPAPFRPAPPAHRPFPRWRQWIRAPCRRFLPPRERYPRTGARVDSPAPGTAAPAPPAGLSPRRAPPSIARPASRSAPTARFLHPPSR